MARRPPLSSPRRNLSRSPNPLPPRIQRAAPQRRTHSRRLALSLSHHSHIHRDRPIGPRRPPRNRPRPTQTPRRPPPPLQTQIPTRIANRSAPVVLPWATLLILPFSFPSFPYRVSSSS